MRSVSIRALHAFGARTIRRARRTQRAAFGEQLVMVERIRSHRRSIAALAPADAGFRAILAARLFDHETMSFALLDRAVALQCERHEAPFAGGQLARWQP